MATVLQNPGALQLPAVPQNARAQSKFCDAFEEAPQMLVVIALFSKMCSNRLSRGVSYEL